MSVGVLLSTVLLAAAAPAASLPDEVRAFIADRQACDHFRGEPVEGDDADARERRAFVAQALEIHCTGTDRRLAALRQRHMRDAAVTAALSGFEDAIEDAAEHDCAAAEGP